MQLTTVESSMVHAIGYDAEQALLQVVYTSGKIWNYEGVPQSEYEALINADSIGSYMRCCIIGLYPEYEVRNKRK